MDFVTLTDWGTGGMTVLGFARSVIWFRKQMEKKALAARLEGRELGRVVMCLRAQKDVGAAAVLWLLILLDIQTAGRVMTAVKMAVLISRLRLLRLPRGSPCVVDRRGAVVGKEL